jgi:hypothetical protein
LKSSKSEQLVEASGQATDAIENIAVYARPIWARGQFGPIFKEKMVHSHLFFAPQHALSALPPHWAGYWSNRTSSRLQPVDLQTGPAKKFGKLQLSPVNSSKILHK